MQEGFTESELICTVIKVLKPSLFREMFPNKSDLTVHEFKRLETKAVLNFFKG